MIATSFRWARPFFIMLLAAILSLPATSASSEAAVNGIVRQVGNYQILNVWGTNYEMGYAHGYLMADRFRDLVEYYMIGILAGGSVAAYNSLLAMDTSPSGFQWQQQYLDEISGMAAGMAASGKNLYVANLGRNIDYRDIRAFNLQDQFFFACSSFGVWKNATADGETILGRNFDFFYDTKGTIANYQLIIAYEPTGKAKFVSFGWPGLVGIYTGLNETGVAVMANTGNVPNTYGGPYHPVMEVFRDILEKTTPYSFPTQPLSSVKSVHELTSEIIQVGIPYQGVVDPVYYIEESPDLDIIRYPTDTDPGYSHIIATNHLIKAAPPPSSGESVDRYRTLRNGLLGLYGSGDGKVDVTEAWGLLRSVASIVAPTLTSIVVRPNRMEFSLSFAKLDNGTFTPATSMDPQTFTWASLFPDRGLPDLIVQSIAATPSSPLPGQSVTVTVTVKNQGGSAAGSYYLDFYRNLASAPLPNQVGDATCAKSGLAAGGTDSCTFTVAFTEAGSYRMWAQADTELQVAETDDANNVAGPQVITVTTVPSTSLTSITLAPTTVTGGSSSQATVNLSAAAPAGGAVISLGDNSSAVSVPATVTVQAGKTNATFTVATSPVTGSRSAAIYAAYSGVTRSAVLTVRPPALSALSLSPTSVTGGSTSTGTVTLNGPAPTGGVTVSLSDNSSAVSVPASVTVPAGKSGATFTVATYSVYSTRSVTVSAAYGGTTRSATLTVRRRL
jgi:CARDB protein